MICYCYATIAILFIVFALVHKKRCMLKNVFKFRFKLKSTCILIGLLYHFVEVPNKKTVRCVENTKRENNLKETKVMYSCSDVLLCFVL